MKIRKPVASQLAMVTAVIAALSTSALAASTDEKINVLCANRWPDDYVMQKECREQQAIAAFTINTFHEQFKND
jgi:hypothetical protein